MIKFIGLGIWVCLVTLGSVFGIVTWQKHKTENPNAASVAKVESMKTRMISVPLLANDDIQGYLITRFEFTVDPDLVKASPVGPEAFVSDEAFKVIYGDTSRDFRLSRKQDIQAVTENILSGANKRLGSEIVKGVFVDSWTFVSKQDMMKTNGHSER